MTDDPDLKALYRRTVMEHSRHPRNFRRLDSPDRTSVGHNPLCGDKLTVFMNLDDDRVAEIGFEGTGCAISLASASIMTEALSGRTIDDARRAAHDVVERFRAGTSGGTLADLGELAALGGVRNYPSRIKCATLAWKTLGAALDDRADPVTTE